METVDEDWLDFWGESATCCESGELDLCGVCDGHDKIYECGCTGLPVDERLYLDECQEIVNPTYLNQACSCEEEVIEDDCGTCGGSNYFMLINQNWDLTGEYCDEGDGWITANEETEVYDICVFYHFYP